MKFDFDNDFRLHLLAVAVSISFLIASIVSFSVSLSAFRQSQISPLRRSPDTVMTLADTVSKVVTSDFVSSSFVCFALMASSGTVLHQTH